MKKLFPLMLVMLAIIMPMKLWAQEPYAVLTTDSATILSQDSTGVTYGKTLTFYYDDQKTAKNGLSVRPFYASSVSWYNQRENITSVVFDDSFANCATLTSTAYWFSGCSKITFITGILNLKTDNVTDMSWMFDGCSGLTNLDVSNFKTDNVTDMSWMFLDCTGLTSLDLSNFKTDNVTNMGSMFDGCSSLTTLDVSHFKTDNVTDMSLMFSGCSGLTSLDVSNFKTDNVTDMTAMFYDCSGLTTLDVSNFNTDNVTNMESMFEGCSSLTNLDVSNFNTANVTIMVSMFQSCSGLTTLNLSNFNTANVTYMGSMFSGCSSLTTLDVSHFNTANVTDMRYMFYSCSGLTNLDVSNFKTDNVTDMRYMFYGCSGLTNLDVSNFKTDNVTDMERMFLRCSDLKSLDLSSFNTSNVKYDANIYNYGIKSMFEGCSALTTIWVGDNWTTANLTESGDVFKDCAALVGGAGTHFDPDHVDYTYAHIDGGPSNPGYFTDIESVRRWDFTKWSSETIANLKADAAASKTTGWSDVEKKADAEAGAEPTEAAKDNCFWLDAETTEANGVAIAELEGLVFNKSYCSSRKLAIAVNYPSTSLGDYAGGAYLWLGDKGHDCFTIPNVKNGQTITIELESHKTSEGRGITLIAGSTELDSFTTMTKASYSWTIPEDCDVVVRNTNGCHIYTITVSGEGTPTDTLEIYAVETGSTITPNQPIMATQSVIVTPGNDVEWPTNMSMGSAWVNPLDFTSNIYYSGSTTTYTFEGSMRGTNNPKDGDLEDGVSTGSGYKPYQKNYPKSGGFLTFEVQQEGSLIIPIRVFAGKPLYVTDKTGTAKKDIQFKDASGQTLALQTNPLCAVSADEDVTGFVSFNVQPGEKYYVFSVGSKARFGGYVFSKQTIDIDPATMANVIDSLDALPITLEPYAVLTTDSATILSQDSTGVRYAQTLTFYYDNQKAERNGMDVGPFTNNLNRGWNDQRENITNVVFDASFANCTTLTSTAFWFHECKQLTSITGISNLNTDNVTDMSGMFAFCPSLTSLDVSGFNTQNVTSMFSMFNSCSGLTSLDVSGFSTANVTNMCNMFIKCSNLTNLNVSNFNTSNVTDISGMFSGCSSLTSLDVSNFNTSNVTNMQYIFSDCSGLTSLDVSHFNTENVTYLDGMFSGCSGLTSLDVSGFKTDNVTGMNWLFSGCTGLTNLDVSNFNTSKVTSMSTMFYGCSGLTSLDLSSFNTGNVTSMQSMFLGCTGLTSLDLSNFNTENVTNMSWMFNKCSSLTSLDLSSFNTSNVKYEYDANNYINYSFGIQSMFEGCSALTTIWVGDNWTTANLTESVDVFKDCAALVGGAGTHFDPDHVDYTYAHIDGGTSNPGYFTDKNASLTIEPYVVLTTDTTSVLSSDSTGVTYGKTLTFYYDNLKVGRNGMDVGPFESFSERGWNSNADSITVVVFDDSFANCTTLTSTALWFSGCRNLKTIVGIENLKTDHVTTMFAMFDCCNSLTSLDVSKFNTENVTRMNDMFSDCRSLTSLDVTNFNTAKVTDMCDMFINCSSLTSLDVSNFKTDSVTNMSFMFIECSGLTSLDLSNFNTAKVTDMSKMFALCSGLTTIYVGNEWTTASVTDGTDMFKGCSAIKGGKGTTYSETFTIAYGNSTSSDYARIDYKGMPGYFTPKYGYTPEPTYTLEGNVLTIKAPIESSVYYVITDLYSGIDFESGDSLRIPETLYTGPLTLDHPVRVRFMAVNGRIAHSEIIVVKYKPIEATFDGRVLAVGGSTTMTDALEAVGGRDEVAKTITAIVWNSSATLSNSDLQGLDNPNLLIYVNERSQAPQNRNNVVVNGLAMNVVLSDTGSGNCDFYAPQTFTAEMITYSREFKQATQVGVCRGWETISLPFMVQTIAHADKGVITPFGVDTSNKHFWLRQLSTNGLVSATKIEANLPYLISMPNDEKNYAKEYILKGLVTFSAENAVVPKTEPTALALADSSLVMMPALQSVAKSSTVWALNVGMERSQYFEGSTFERDYREVRPFEAYTVHRSDTPAPRFLPINDLMNSATGIETISNVIISHDNYYRLDGRKVDGKPTKKGLYITNGRKVVIK